MSHSCTNTAPDSDFVKNNEIYVFWEGYYKPIDIAPLAKAEQAAQESVETATEQPAEPAKAVPAESEKKE